MRLEDLALLLQLAQEYAASMGDVALDLTIRLKGGSQIAHPVPPAPLMPHNRIREAVDPAPGSAAPTAPESAPEPASAARLHSADFRVVYWDGAEYRLSPAQARVVQLLWEAANAGMPEVGQAAILEGAESIGESVRDLFKNSPAWGKLIVSTSKGVFRLAK